MESIVGILVAPIIIFLIFVAPFWLFFHYRSKNQMSQGLSEQETTQLFQLASSAEKMAQRIESLEKILDSEAPEWRSQ